MFSRSILSSAFIFKALLLFLITVASTQAICAPATKLNEDEPRWRNFRSYMIQQNNKNHIDGLSYIISGGLATAGGVYGYETSTDPLAKAVFGLSQSLGIVAIGYGAFKWANGNEHSMIFQTLEKSKMTPEQKDEFLTAYFEEVKKQRKQSKLIKAVTHGLVAALNTYHAATEKNKDLKSAFYFIGGINALAAISYSF